MYNLNPKRRQMDQMMLTHPSNGSRWLSVSESGDSLTGVNWCQLCQMLGVKPTGLPSSSTRSKSTFFSSVIVTMSNLADCVTSFQRFWANPKMCGRLQQPHASCTHRSSHTSFWSDQRMKCMQNQMEAYILHAFPKCKVMLFVHRWVRLSWGSGIQEWKKSSFEFLKEIF